MSKSVQSHNKNVAFADIAPLWGKYEAICAIVCSENWVIYFTARTFWAKLFVFAFEIP